VSVCVPAYRAERHLAETIESVMAQTLDDWELIVVDDASTDATFDVAKTYADSERIRVERNPVNLGPTSNWNHVIGLARGQYVKLLCSDDTLRSTCLQRQAAAFATEPGVGLVAARRDVIDDEGRVVIGAFGLSGLRGRVDGRRALTRMVETATTPFGEPSVVLFRAEALRRAGPFRPDYATLADVDMYARVLAHWDCVLLDETLAAFRVRPGSWSARSHRVQGADLRRLLADLAAVPDLALPRAALARGRALSYVRAPAREAVFRAAEWRRRFRPSPRRRSSG
jgi:glycosyltransferase involved in cell wall biosynthesis